MHDAPKQSLSWGAPLIMLAVLAGLFLLVRYFDLDIIRQFIAQAGWWAPAILVIAKASTIVIAPLGGSPLYPIAGALFGFWKGVGLLILGDALGGVISFYLSRWFGRALVDRFFSDHKLVQQVLTRLNSVRGLLVARIAFITFPEIISYAAGLTSIGFWPFFIIYTAIGAIPTVIAAGLGSLLVGEDNSLIYLGMMVTAGVLASIGYLYFMREEKTAPEEAGGR